MGLSEFYGDGYDKDPKEWLINFKKNQFCSFFILYLSLKDEAKKWWGSMTNQNSFERSLENRKYLDR